MAHERVWSHCSVWSHQFVQWTGGKTCYGLVFFYLLSTNGLPSKTICKPLSHTCLVAAPCVQIPMITKQLSMRGFLVNQWEKDFPKGHAQMAEWITQVLWHNKNSPSEKSVQNFLQLLAKRSLISITSWLVSWLPWLPCWNDILVGQRGEWLVVRLC